MSNLPKLFIGSSSEGRELAEYLQAALVGHCEAEVWDQFLFVPGSDTLGDLLSFGESYDFAALVLTPDDLVETRSESRRVARDNVLLELGLFLGSLGRSRVFAIASDLSRASLPSDLNGITVINCSIQPDANVRAAVNPIALRVREGMRRLGPRSSGKTQLATHSLTEGVHVLANLMDEDNREITGRLRQGQDIKFMAHTGYNAMVSMYQPPIREAVENGAALKVMATDPEGPLMRLPELSDRLCPSIRQREEVIEVIEACRRHARISLDGGYTRESVALGLFQGIPHVNLLIIDDWLRVVTYLPLVDAAECPVLEVSNSGDGERFFSRYSSAFRRAWADARSVNLLADGDAGALLLARAD
jgi:hypothetical protein